MKKLHVGSNNRKCSNTCCRQSTFILLTSTAKLIRTSSSVLDKRSSATRNTTFPSSSTPSLESTNQSHCVATFYFFCASAHPVNYVFALSVRVCVRACSGGGVRCPAYRRLTSALYHKICIVYHGTDVYWFSSCTKCYLLTAGRRTVCKFRFSFVDLAPKLIVWDTCMGQILGLQIDIFWSSSLWWRSILSIK